MIRMALGNKKDLINERNITKEEINKIVVEKLNL
jgi:hypothetical protein